VVAAGLVEVLMAEPGRPPTALNDPEVAMPPSLTVDSAPVTVAVAAL
jgi:hypothetical protein